MAEQGIPDCNGTGKSFQFRYQVQPMNPSGKHGLVNQGFFPIGASPADFQNISNLGYNHTMQPNQFLAGYMQNNPVNFANTTSVFAGSPVEVDVADSYFRAEFLNREKWKREYQRNNRNGGMKNLRCFPYCGAKHYASGFCGESLLLQVNTNFSKKYELFAYCEIALSELHTINKLSNTYKEKSIAPCLVSVGTILSRHEIQGLLRTRENPCRDWWVGDKRGARNVHNGQEICFEFNRAKRGWHYGWVANKYISDSEHAVRAYLFVPLNQTFVKCVHITTSPKFRLYSRKPKRKLVDANIENKRLKTVEEAETRLAQTIPEASTFDFASVVPGPDLDNDFLEDVFSGATEKIVNELKSNSKNFKGENVFKMLQKLLQLSKEDFSKYLTDRAKTPNNELISNGAPFKEIVALRAFAAFLLSDEEDVTAELQARMKGTNPFGKNLTGKVEEISIVKAESDGPKRMSDLMKLAQEKFDKFLSTFNLNVDVYTKFSENNQYFPQSIFIEKVEADKSPRQRCKNQVLEYTEEVVNLLTQTNGNWRSSQGTLSVYDEMYKVMSIPYALRKCYLSITGHFCFQYKELEGLPSIESKYHPKLFSAGLINYILDGVTRPWPIASPLISTKYDAINLRAYLKQTNEGQIVIVLEHIYSTYKMVRALTDITSLSISGTVSLYERWNDFDGSIEWVEVLKGNLLFSKNQ